jgi:hypothetical protein
VTGAVDGHGTALVLLGDAKSAEDVACEDGGEETVLLSTLLVWLLKKVGGKGDHTSVLLARVMASSSVLKVKIVMTGL